MSGTEVAYEDFLKEKVNFDKSFGFEVDAAELSPVLLGHQRAIVQWAVKGGRRAIFAQFGTGKTLMQLEILRLILAHEGGRALIICPLGVRQEFARDARNLLDMDVTFVRRDAEVTDDGLYITNYESVRDGRLNPHLFTAVSLDEASILRSYGSKTYQTFLSLFGDIKYRFVATATPSPNRYKELIHYAGFLGVMDSGQALTRFFQRDSTQANNLTLYPHKVEEFWLWLSSWSVWLNRPSDLGFSDEGYDLPGHAVVWDEVEVAPQYGTERDGQGTMFRNSALGVSHAAKAKRDTLEVRIAEMMRIIDGYVLDTPPSLLAAGESGSVPDQLVIWCDLNAEQDAIERALKARGLSFSSIYGSLTVEECERRLAEWRDRRTYALIGKPVMLGQGLNLQQCNKAIFLGVTFKFNDVVQATHRIHRYGQIRPCETTLIYADSEREVVDILRKKWVRHDELTDAMSDVIREHGLNQSSINEALTRSMGVERVEMSGDGWLVANNDCVAETRSMKTGSVDLIVTSIPFSNHYEYTPCYNDFGHTDNNDHFWAQMDYLTPELLRVLAPGRMYCCHVKDRILFGNVTDKGASTVSPFHAEALMHGIKHGFDYMGMITVTTDVVRENNQSYRLGWSEVCKDSTKMGVGSPEYILLFRAPQTDRTRGYADTPVTHSKDDYTRARWQTDAHAFWRADGNRQLVPDDMLGLTADQRARLFTAWTLAGVYDYEAHIRIGESLDERGALPATFMGLEVGSNHPDVWHDINRMLTLNTEQSRRAQAMHVCPLQFGIVDRLIERYSNPGDLVYDPFGGLFTVPVRALKKGRRGRAVELNPGYFLDGVRYCQAAERAVGAPTLFDLVDLEAQDAVA
jgi:DNA methylase